MPKTVRKNQLQTSANKLVTQSKNQTKRFDISSDRFSYLLIATGLLLLSYFALHHYFYWRSLQVSRAQVAVQEPAQSLSSAPSHIFIRWFVDSDIEPMALVGDEWGVSPDRTSFLVQSARPGDHGNIILYGHNKREILGNIRALKGGEQITLTTADGKTHLYKVSAMKETDTSDVSWLQPTSFEVLTMYTCSGPLDSKRFQVRAVPIDQ